MPFGPSVRVQHIVAADYFGLGIGKKCEGKTGFVAEIFRNVRRIHADRNGYDAFCLELGKPLLNASQLEDTERSPVAAVENQQHSLGRSASGRSQQELRQGDRVAFAVGQGEVGHALSNLRSSG
jgi:hypothetical protein